MTNELRMNQTPLRRWMGELGEVVGMALPIIVTMLSQTVMQFVDTLFLGRYGEPELAAATPAGLTFFTIGAFMLGMMSCNSTFVSQSFGRGQTHDCARYTVHALSLGVVAQVVMLPLMTLAPMIFQGFGHEHHVQELEVSYFRMLSWRVAGMSMLAALAAFYQGTGRPVIPMITGISANIVNAIGAYALIFGKFGMPEMGIRGAGLMTTIATYFEVALLLAVFLSKPMHEKFRSREWGPFELKRIWQIVRIGFPAGLTFALDLGSWTLFIAGVVGRLGKDVLAGNNAAMAVMHLSFMPAVGLSIGVTAVVGRHIGMGDIEGAKRRAYMGMAAACAYMTLMGVLFFIFCDPLIRVFFRDPMAQPEAVRYGALILSYVVFFQFSDAIGIVSAGALKGAGDTRFPALAQIVLAWCFFLPFVMWLAQPKLGGVHGAWVAATIYIWLYDAVLFWRFFSERWRKIDIFA